MKDLDLNGDGEIDTYEFSRWYFSGMKAYNGSTRTLLKLGNKSRKILDVVANEAKSVLLGQELKVKVSNLNIGFNAPENP